MRPIAWMMCIAGSLFASEASAAKLLAVLPLDVSHAKNKVDADARDDLEEMLRDVATDELTPTGWTILTGETTLQVLQDNGIDPNKCGDQSCHLSMAREIKAEKFLSGNVRFVDGKFSASIRLIDTATGRILATESIEGATVTELKADFRGKVHDFFSKGGMVGAAHDSAAAQPPPENQSALENHPAAPPAEVPPVAPVQPPAEAAPQPEATAQPSSETSPSTLYLPAGKRLSLNFGISAPSLVFDLALEFSLPVWRGLRLHFRAGYTNVAGISVGRFEPLVLGYAFRVYGSETTRVELEPTLSVLDVLVVSGEGTGAVFASDLGLQLNVVHKSFYFFIAPLGVAIPFAEVPSGGSWPPLYRALIGAGLRL